MQFIERYERWAYVAVALLVLALGVRYGQKAVDERSAFCRWRSQLLDMANGEDISAKHNYPNPPVMAVILEPFAQLPPAIGATLWYLLKAGMAGLCVWWIVHLVQAGGTPYPAWARLLTLLLFLKPALDDLSHGNVNLFILFLCVACLVAYSAQRGFLAGLLLALAVACKVTPALFIPYFVWKRAWSVLVGGVVGCVLFFFPGLVPAARLGMDANLKQLNSWYGVMVKPFVTEGKVTSEHINQSLPGALFRLGSDSPSFVTFKKDGDRAEMPARYDNLISLPHSTIKLLVKLCLGLFGLLVVLTCHSTRRDGWQATAEYGIIFLGMLLFSERTWKTHAVALAMPLAVLAYYVTLPARRWATLVAWAAILLSFVLMVLPGFSGGGERETVYHAPGLGKMALVYGAYTFAFLIQLVAMVALLRAGASSQGPAIPQMDERRTLAA
jgi:hypothetical protein